MARPTHAFPPCWPASRWLGRLALRLVGWRVDGLPPEATPRAVLIAAPHTSNWDYVLALFVGWSVGLSFQWLGKHALFRPPLGVLLRWLGGRSVDRSSPHGLVHQIASQIRAADRILLMVPAEGTRSWRPYWKSGFWYIARAAEVPIVLGYLDYGRKRAGFGPVLVPGASPMADMDAIRAFYSDKEALFPQHKGRVRLEVEDGGGANEESTSRGTPDPERPARTPG